MFLYGNHFIRCSNAYFTDRSLNSFKLLSLKKLVVSRWNLMSLFKTMIWNQFCCFWVVFSFFRSIYRLAITDKIRSVNNIFNQVILKTWYHKSNVLVIIRFRINFHYPTIKKTLVTAVSNMVYKLRFL